MERENQLRWPTFKEIPITYILTIVNIVVFVLLEIIGDTTDISFMVRHGAMNPYLILKDGQCYTLYNGY